MLKLDRAFPRLMLAGAFLFVAATAAPAAGALAVGACGAYGFAIDYARNDTARTSRFEQVFGQRLHRRCPPRSATARRWRSMVKNACGPFGYAAAAGLGLVDKHGRRSSATASGGKDCVIRAFVCDAKG